MSRNIRSLVVFVAALSAACGGGGSSTGEGTGAGGGTGTSTAGTGGSGSEAPAGGMTASSGPTASPPPPAAAHVRVIHASPEAAAATVAVYMDTGATPAIPSLAYKAAAGYADAPAGQHAVAVRPAAAAADSAPAISAQTPALEGDHYYTAIAHGLASAHNALAISFAEDNGARPEAGHAALRFFHALNGVAAVDLCLPGATARAAGTPVFTNVAYGAFATPASGSGQYADVPAGSAVRIQVRAHAATACSGAVAGVVTITPEDRSVVTAVAVGNAGRPAVTKEVLVCTDAPAVTGASSCTAVPIAAR